ncbi:hypothetical protein E0Z10_g9916 [Xylaria hypoxylon]|uniref:Uncharacterized protein n=1 Tax=Xylaria hypoxylon TaxID=37992 RepID=A0A4Z0YFZ4_9PEZI|nr:hypothetical protein E0Z10_g9916 [Xylaria hypoxylon]
MASNRPIGNPYSDERRHAGPHREPYRLGERDRPPMRRDSRDGRYRHEPADVRSPHEPRNAREYRRDNEPPRPRSEANPRILEGPRSMSSNSAAGAPDKPSEELHFKRINIASDKHITTNSATGNVPTPTMPKAKNPELQDAFENVYNWGEKLKKRLLLSIRQNKVAQESNQRRLENEKIDKSAKSFAPFIGLNNRFNATDSALNEQLKVVDDEYYGGIERLVACLTAVPEPAAANHQDPVIASLEAKIDQISQLAAKQTEQIKGLLEENKKYSALKADHDALQLKFSTFDNAIYTLQSQQANIDTENKSLKKQLEDLQSDTKNNLKSSEVQLTELSKRLSIATEAQELFETVLKERITGIETKLDDFTDYDDIKGKLDELDLVTFNEICQTWVDNNLKTQFEQSNQRHQDDSSTQEALQSLRQEVDSLRNSHATVSQPDKGIDLSMEAIEATISTKIAAAEKSINEDINKLCQGRDNIYGDLIDGAVARITILERGASNYSGLEPRIQLLERWKADRSTLVNQTQDPNLAERVTFLEGKKVGHRVDRIDLDVGDLNRKYEALKSEVGQLVKHDWFDLRLQDLLKSVSITSGLVNDVKDLQRKIPTIELATKALDTQFQNLSTKQLAEQIVRLTNPVFEQRLGKLEVKTNNLEANVNKHDRTVNHHAQQLKQFSGLVRVWEPGEKRTTSPGHLDEPSKKRKLDTNGRHPSPLQQQQRNNRDRHPSA